MKNQLKVKDKASGPLKKEQIKKITDDLKTAFSQVSKMKSRDQKKPLLTEFLEKL